MRIIPITALLLFGLFGTVYLADAQDVFESLQRTAEMHNEQAGIEEDNELSEQERRYKERWEREWKEKMEEHEAMLNGLDSYEECVALMVLYLTEYYKLADKAEAESNCKMKYDLYGMQLLALTSSTTIMYCPEKISNLPEDLQNEVIKNFVSPHIEVDDDGAPSFKITFWGSKLKPLYHRFAPDFARQENPDYPWYFMQWLWGHFHPQSFVEYTFEIGQKMEALGCGG